MYELTATQREHHKKGYSQNINTLGMQHIEEPYLQDNQGKQGSRQKGDNLGMPFWGRGGGRKKKGISTVKALYLSL